MTDQQVDAAVERALRELRSAAPGSQLDLPVGVPERVFFRLTAAIGGLGGPSELAPSHSATAEGTVSGLATGSAGAVRKGLTLLSGKIAAGVAIYALGAASGAGMYAATHPAWTESSVPAPVVSVTGILSPSVAALAPELPSALPTASVSEVMGTPGKAVPMNAPPPSAAPAASSIGKDDRLAAERALLEMARTALARSQAGAALQAVDRHAQEFPRGRLTEEREALRIQALVASGRGAEARQRAEVFRKTFPRSLLLPAIDAVTK